MQSSRRQGGTRWHWNDVRGVWLCVFSFRGRLLCPLTGPRNNDAHQQRATSGQTWSLNTTHFPLKETWVPGEMVDSRSETSKMSLECLIPSES